MTLTEGTMIVKSYVRCYYYVFQNVSIVKQSSHLAARVMFLAAVLNGFFVHVSRNGGLPWSARHVNVRGTPTSAMTTDIL